ncbi:hypothetical protein G9A89_020617 [Geosiphon pyriformis]|nr:hypothetical protein G9A89_020617 [Geosiphon pyriformis]
MTYIGKFNKLLRWICQLETNNYYSDAQILDQFITGLKDKLIKKVRPYAPEDLNSAIQHVKRYEMAMEEANCTKLVNLAIRETSSAAEEKINQLTKKINHPKDEIKITLHYFPITSPRIAITVKSLTTGKKIAESYNETNKIGVINVTLHHSNLIINHHHQLTIHQDPNTKITIISPPHNQFNSNTNNHPHNIIKLNHYHTQPSYLTMPEEQNFHHTVLLEANESPFLFSNAVANEQKAITAMYTEAEVEGKPIRLILDSEFTRSIITYQLMQQLKKNVDRPAQTVIITADSMKKTPVPAICGTFNKCSEKAPAFEFEPEEKKPIIETFMALGLTSNWADKTEQEYFTTHTEPKTSE